MEIGKDNAGSADATEVDRTKLEEGRYANYFEVGHNAFEFVLDFGQAFENEPVRIYLRVIATPDSARRLWKVLQDALDKYHNTFGTLTKDDIA